MFETVLKVQFVSLKNSFVYLSPSHKSLHTGTIIKLQHDRKEAYFSANIVGNIVDDDSIGINHSYAKLLDISENELVNISQIEHLPVVNSIGITPISTADYNVLEMFAENIQSNLLDQVRVVNVKQKLMIWIGQNLSVSVLVDNVQPVAPGVLDFLTEVVIKFPPTSITKESNDNRKPISDKSFADFLFKPSIVKDTVSSQLDKSLSQIELCCRLLPLSKIAGKLKNSWQLHPFMTFVHRRTFQERIFPYTRTSEFFALTPLGASFPDKKIYVKLCQLEDYFDTLDRACNSLIDIFVDDSVLTFYKCEFGVKANLRGISPLSGTREIEVHCKADKSINVVEKLKIYLSRYCEARLIWNPSFPLEIAENLYCSLKFLPESQDYCVIDEQFLRNCSYSLVEGLVLKISPSKQSQVNIDTEFLPMKKTCEKIFDVLLTHHESSNIIITGRGGAGKTSLLKHLANAVSNHPHFLSTELLHCKAIKGKTTDSLHKYFTDAVTGVIAHQPSLLLLDDLDVLCEKFDGEETPNSVYATRASEMLYSLFSTLTEQNSIKIIATVASILKLNREMYRSRGNHLFKHVFPIDELTKTDRKSILKWYLTQHRTEDCIDYDELSLKTDGFVIKDITKLYEKVLFQASKESSNDWQELVIRQEHCDAVLSKSCALSLQNIKFHSPGDKSFQDIGGMTDIKSALVESLLWPVKYPTVFANSPIKLQSGFLLYGAPGTGKTLIAGAAAKRCNLKFISVKGPELLSKYIGGSEQAVRDVFEKAQRAKPCILFFDEFDSLARRRGHDNTGVTDRVVNQLLTELDGIETLTGVYVLAATSRPDLLDPALLRPGRLDRQLLCPMPNEKERLEILQVLSKNLNSSDDVDLQQIASQTGGFSGADLKSLLFTAQMSSVDTSKDYSKVESLQISQDLLIKALYQTRPSIGKSERAKLEQIYAQFEGGNLENFKVDSMVTLA